jgi:hypothetical protein
VAGRPGEGPHAFGLILVVSFQITERWHAARFPVSSAAEIEYTLKDLARLMGLEYPVPAT